MSPVRVLICLPLAGLLVVGGAGAAEERLLFDNPDYEVTVAGDYSCGEPVPITVYSDRPELFEAGSVELQRIADAAQAVLALECPRVDVLEMEGRLSGLGEPVYAGVAEAQSGWELAARQSIQSEQYEEAYEDYQASPGEDDGYGASGSTEGFTVANLSAGMTVEEARAAVADTFGVEPDYDAGHRILSMRTGGCRADYDWAALSPRPEAGWKCLQAWFTDQRQARMYLLDLVQVIESNDPAAVEQRLVDRFGEPVYRDTQNQERGLLHEDRSSITVLGWGEVVQSPEAAAAGVPDMHTLQAKVLPIDNVTVVTVNLYRPDLQPGRAAGSEDGRRGSVPDLTL